MACTMKGDEDTILDYENIQVSQEIVNILLPHKKTLHTILVAPREVPSKSCPALSYLRDLTICFSKNIEMAWKKNSLVPFTGDLSPNDCASVNAFFYRYLHPATSNRNRWLQKAPVAHAITLIILSRKFQNLPPVNSEEYLKLLREAWDWQTQSRPPKGVDVDREAISILERRMFETSKAAGPASYQQWGLDSGTHQDKWSPYPDIPEEWNLRDYDEHEEDVYQVITNTCHHPCQHGTYFIFYRLVVGSGIAVMVNKLVLCLLHPSRS